MAGDEEAGRELRRAAAPGPRQGEGEQAASEGRPGPKKPARRLEVAVSSTVTRGAYGLSG